MLAAALDLAGGETAFTPGSCPASAAEAEELLSHAEVVRVSPNMTEEDLAEPLKDVDESTTVKADAADAAADTTMNVSAGTAVLDSKIAAREAKEAALNASEATLSVKKDAQSKRELERATAADDTKRIKKEVADLDAAIDQAKGLGNVSNSTGDMGGSGSITETLAAESVAKMREAQNSEEKEATLGKDVKDAKRQTKAAADNVAVAKEEVEFAKSEEDETRSALNEDEDPSAADAGEVVTAGCRWTPSPKCVHTFTYLGKMYDGCNVDVDRYIAWCSHDLLYNGNWSSCVWSCGSPGALTNASAS